MATEQKQNFRENNKVGVEQKEQAQNPKDTDPPNKKATEQLLRQIFTRHKESPGASNNELTQEVSRAFQLFRADSSDLLGSKSNSDKESNIQDRITNLQKRTSEMLHILTSSMEKVRSVVLLDTKPNPSDDVDESVISDTRTLDKLTEEIRKIQIQEPSTGSSAVMMERPDIDDMKDATDTLLNDLGHVSDRYNCEKNSTSWLTTANRKQQ